MKRALEELETELDQIAHSAAVQWASPESKRPRLPAGGGDATWDVDRAIFHLRNAAMGIHGDQPEMGRLLQGAMTPATLLRRGVSSGLYPNMWLALADSYEALWHSLGNAGAVAATRSDLLPPTFADVQDAYFELEEKDAVNAHMSELESESGTASLNPYHRLGKAVDRAAQRAQIVALLGVGNYEHYPAPFSEVWDPALRTDHLSTCDETEAYLIIVNPPTSDGRGDAYLLKDADTVMASAAIEIGEDQAPRFLDAYMRPYSHEAEDPRRVLYPYNDEEVSDFLGLLALPDNVRPQPPFYPMPAGVAQVKQALVPIPSLHSLDGADGTILETLNDDLHEIPIGRLRALWLTECQLTLALQLFVGQVRARRRIAARRQIYAGRAPTLFEAASLAYGGPLDASTLPAEVADAVAPVARDLACAAPALPDGRLPGADRLLDIAAQWDRRLDEAEAQRPELLCFEFERTRRSPAAPNTDDGYDDEDYEDYEDSDDYTDDGDDGQDS
ncbi:hypothetical protein pmac_cds_309 [Pandoravirus macleodensis]|uniref:Uncharacterized protein n=1 Tax=Pandoravirus macleodensis TaxID=2107707 RepID=A0A2U7UEX9_9VIRU|nr:hypothetical protein pmac_cds_309 [Pandoravirus macleodensis]AVK76997.1 hypothetical protein pmac_cds_309 [Pandoravirus macleodensis]